MTNMNATIYEKHGKYQISISWTVNGKRFRKSKATGLPVKGNKRKAQAMADAFMAEMESKVSDGYTDMLFSDYMKQWLEDVKFSRGVLPSDSQSHLPVVCGTGPSPLRPESISH